MQLKECLLGDVVTFQRGHDLPKARMVNGPYPVLGSNGIIGYHNKYTTTGPVIVVGRSGNVGRPFMVKSDAWAHNTSLYIKDFKGNDPIFIYYFLQTLNLERFAGGSAVPTLNRNHISTIDVKIPADISTQRKIGAILASFDAKISINNKINDNLQQQVMTLYQQMFIKKNNDARRECRADEYFDISIGKTPPRKELQWFSENPVDHAWVSISDMASCGLYVANSSEYLTHEAVQRFNVKVVPDNTVLLSFKLTVGRVAITDGEVTTNEAIAHFKTSRPEITEYLFCYLKNFKYETMGSTSSIATAVNSKILKGMPFVIPTDGELESFRRFSEPIFRMIKSNQRENTQLAKFRDTLLPKIILGETDISDILQ